MVLILSASTSLRELASSSCTEICSSWSLRMSMPDSRPESRATRNDASKRRGPPMDSSESTARLSGFLGSGKSSRSETGLPPAVLRQSRSLLPPGAPDMVMRVFADTLPNSRNSSGSVTSMMASPAWSRSVLMRSSSASRRFSSG